VYSSKVEHRAFNLVVLGSSPNAPRYDFFKKVYLFQFVVFVFLCFLVKKCNFLLFL
jgi:hypothetical protein